MSLTAIGAGFGRTGTESLRQALDMLGLGPTHHMYEVMDSKEQKERWLALAKGETPDWSALFQGFNCAVDWPSAAYWRETMEAFPVAKVILTHRPAEDWWASFSKTILVAIQSGKDVGGVASAVIADCVFKGRPDDKDHAISTYLASIDDVRRTVPKHRLIDMPLGAGWKPLCDGFGLTVPAAPFPSGNTKSQFRAER